jgi:hypothetical protein
MDRADLGDSINCKPQHSPGVDTLSMRLMDEVITDKNKSLCDAADSLISKNDLDKNGQLSFLELANIFGKETGTGVRDQNNQITAIETINLLDKDHNNEISVDELVAAAKQPEPFEPTSVTQPEPIRPPYGTYPATGTSPFTITPIGGSSFTMEKPFWTPADAANLKMEKPFFTKADEPSARPVLDWLFLPAVK